ncbi:hypothetical protein [Gluconobacter sp. GP1]|uniref:tetratricopeptide repeat protein n=1 Tax=Gluconobacter sp. GP1 TaxID=3046423 RepID=UPI00293E9BE4|nr:hypothetical protein [Gluconobacter sp. GP1]
MFNLKRNYKNKLAARGMNIEGYYLDFIETNSKNIVITFENAHEPEKLRPDENRLPWGAEFLNKKNYNVLGIKPIEVDWYRKNSIHIFFRSKEFNSFISKFETVVFYGSSMGGYAALTFSQAVPGSTVIAFNPQSSLDPNIIPWDTRHTQAWKQDWTGDFSDARDGAKLARKVYIAYDPFDQIDNLHVARLHSENLILLKFFCVGHVVAEWMRQAGILEEFTISALMGIATAKTFFKLAQKRRDIPQYYLQMSNLRNSSKVSEICLERIFSIAKKEYLADNILSKIVRNCENFDFLNKDHVINSISSLDNDLIFSISKCMSDMGKHIESLNLCKKIEVIRPINYKLYFNMAESAHRAGFNLDAYFYAKKSISMNEKISNSFRIMTRILWDLGVHSEAIRYSIAGLKIDNKSLLGWLDLGEIYKECGKTSEALFSFIQASRLCPQDKNIKNKIKLILDKDITYFLD